MARLSSALGKLVSGLRRTSTSSSNNEHEEATPSTAIVERPLPRPVRRTTSSNRDRRRESTRVLEDLIASENSRMAAAIPSAVPPRTATSLSERRSVYLPQRKPPVASESLRAVVAKKRIEHTPLKLTPAELTPITGNLYVCAAPLNLSVTTVGPKTLARKSQLAPSKFSAISLNAHLSSLHPNSFMIFNLCDSATYDPALFGYNVARFPDLCKTWRLSSLIAFCRALSAWLELRPSNVAVVLCQDGLLRSGIAVACYLEYSRQAATALLGFDIFLARRSKDDRSWAPNSAFRYLSYFNHIICRGGRVPHETAIVVTRLQLHGISAVAESMFAEAGHSPFGIQISCAGAPTYTISPSATILFNQNVMFEIPSCKIILSRDISIRLYWESVDVPLLPSESATLNQINSKKPIAKLHNAAIINLNTAFFPPGCFLLPAAEFDWETSSTPFKNNNSNSNSTTDHMLSADFTLELETRAYHTPNLRNAKRTNVQPHTVSASPTAAPWNNVISYETALGRPLLSRLLEFSQLLPCTPDKLHADALVRGGFQSALVHVALRITNNQPQQAKRLLETVLTDAALSTNGKLNHRRTVSEGAGNTYRATPRLESLASSAAWPYSGTRSATVSVASSAAVSPVAGAFGVRENNSQHYHYQPAGLKRTTSSSSLANTRDVSAISFAPSVSPRPPPERNAAVSFGSGYGSATTQTTPHTSPYGGAVVPSISNSSGGKLQLPAPLTPSMPESKNAHFVLLLPATSLPPVPTLQSSSSLNTLEPAAAAPPPPPPPPPPLPPPPPPAGLARAFIEKNTGPRIRSRRKLHWTEITNDPKRNTIWNAQMDAPDDHVDFSTTPTATLASATMSGTTSTGISPSDFGNQVPPKDTVAINGDNHTGIGNGIWEPNLSGAYEDEKPILRRASHDPLFDVEKFEKLFCITEGGAADEKMAAGNGPRKSAGQSGASSSSSSSALLSSSLTLSEGRQMLLDLRRISNTEIALKARFGSKHQQQQQNSAGASAGANAGSSLNWIIDAVREFDTERLGFDDVAVVSGMVPTAEECKLLLHPPPGFVFDRAEGFLATLAAFTGASFYFACWHGMKEAVPEIRECGVYFEAVAEACERIRKSSRLTALMRAVLKLGNLTNYKYGVGAGASASSFAGGAGGRGGRAPPLNRNRQQQQQRTQASGFRVASLVKLNDVKGNDGTSTLLHYLAETLETDTPRLLEVCDEFAELAGLCGRSTSEMVGKYFEHLASLNKLERQRRTVCPAAALLLVVGGEKSLAASSSSLSTLAGADTPNPTPPPSLSSENSTSPATRPLPRPTPPSDGERVGVETAVVSESRADAGVSVSARRLEDFFRGTRAALQEAQAKLETMQLVWTETATYFGEEASVFYVTTPTDVGKCLSLQAGESEGQDRNQLTLAPPQKPVGADAVAVPEQLFRILGTFFQQLKRAREENAERVAREKRKQERELREAQRKKTVRSKLMKGVTPADAVDTALPFGRHGLTGHQLKSGMDSLKTNKTMTTTTTKMNGAVDDDDNDYDSALGIAVDRSGAGAEGDDGAGSNSDLRSVLPFGVGKSGSPPNNTNVAGTELGQQQQQLARGQEQEEQKRKDAMDFFAGVGSSGSNALQSDALQRSKREDLNTKLDVRAGNSGGGGDGEFAKPMKSRHEFVRLQQQLDAGVSAGGMADANLATGDSGGGTHEATAESTPSASPTTEEDIFYSCDGAGAALNPTSSSVPGTPRRLPGLLRVPSRDWSGLESPLSSLLTLYVPEEGDILQDGSEKSTSPLVVAGPVGTNANANASSPFVYALSTSAAEDIYDTLLHGIEKSNPEQGEETEQRESRGEFREPHNEWSTPRGGLDVARASEEQSRRSKLLAATPAFLRPRGLDFSNVPEAKRARGTGFDSAVGSMADLVPEKAVSDHSIVPLKDTE